MRLSHRLPLVLAALAAAAAPVHAEMVGKPAPDFALHSLEGPNLRLSEMRGEVVMINFWATWCGPCRQEMPLLDQMYQQYHAVGFEVLGVNVDEVGSRAADMARTLGVKFPVLFDETKAVSKLYGIDSMPMTVVVGRDGTVRYVHQGYQPGSEQATLDQVRQALKE